MLIKGKQAPHLLRRRLEAQPKAEPSLVPPVGLTTKADEVAPLDLSLEAGTLEKPRQQHLRHVAPYLGTEVVKMLILNRFRGTPVPMLRDKPSTKAPRAERRAWASRQSWPRHPTCHCPLNAAPQRQCVTVLPQRYSILHVLDEAVRSSRALLEEVRTKTSDLMLGDAGLSRLQQRAQEAGAVACWLPHILSRQHAGRREECFWMAFCMLRNDLELTLWPSLADVERLWPDKCGLLNQYRLLCHDILEFLATDPEDWWIIEEAEVQLLLDSESTCLKVRKDATAKSILEAHANKSHRFWLRNSAITVHGEYLCIGAIGRVVGRGLSSIRPASMINTEELMDLVRRLRVKD